MTSRHHQQSSRTANGKFTGVIRGRSVPPLTSDLPTVEQEAGVPARGQERAAGCPAPGRAPDFPTERPPRAGCAR